MQLSNPGNERNANQIDPPKMKNLSQQGVPEEEEEGGMLENRC